MGLVTLIEGKELVLDTGAHAVLRLTCTGGRWGIGAFEFRGTAIGKSMPCLMRQDIYSLTYAAESASIEKDDGEHAIVVLEGEDKHFVMSVRIEIARGVPAFSFGYTLKPVNPQLEPLVVDIPVDASNVTFVQKPLCPGVGPGWNGRYYLLPTRERLPCIMARLRSGDRETHLVIGYHLKTDDILRGRIEYDPMKESAFGVYFPYKMFTAHRELKDIRYTTRFVVSLGESQARSVMAYAQHCGFDCSSPKVRSVEDAAEGVHTCYRNAGKIYVRGKGYLFKMFTDSGEPCLNDYGRFAGISYNPHISWHLYEYWRSRKHETWARERAAESAGFYLANQRESGAVPQLWEITTDRIRGFNRNETTYLYNTCHLSIGSYGLFKYARAVAEEEGADTSGMIAAAFRALRYLADRMDSSGKLGRSFNDEGAYDTLTPEPWALIAFEYASTLPGGADFDEYRDRLERFTVDRFVRENRWMNWSSDGVWKGGGATPENYDNFQPFTFIAYCMRRFARTKERRYIDLAEHVFWYTWLGTIPDDPPGFRLRAKGLSFEQSFYQTYDIPYRACTLIDGLPALSEATGNAFYCKYFAMLLQTQFHYQAADTPYPAFYIGLWMPDKEGDGNPMDEEGEPRMVYTVEWPMMFLEALRSPLWRDSVTIRGRTYRVDEPEA